MKKIVERAKEYFESTIKSTSDNFNLLTHVPVMVKWAEKILSAKPEADKTVVMLAVWLHDISHYTGEYGTFDHAEKSAQMARNFLVSERVDPSIVNQVCHCVRSHRNGDIKPETIEAKIVVAIDSASHMTYDAYLDIMNKGENKYLKGKMARDYRDIALIPEVKEIAEPFYHLWEEIIEKYQKFIES